MIPYLSSAYSVGSTYLLHFKYSWEQTLALFEERKLQETTLLLCVYDGYIFTKIFCCQLVPKITFLL